MQRWAHKCTSTHTRRNQHRKDKYQIQQREEQIPKKIELSEQNRESLQEEFGFLQKSHKGSHLSQFTQLKSKSVSQEEKKAQHSKSKQRFRHRSWA